MTGIITDIQRFSLHDGPGIRTTVFLKGCNLRCRWCHNPEAIRPHPELQVLPAKCIVCGACLAACPRQAHVQADGRRQFHRDRCIACGACARGCYAEALVLVGRELTVEEVVEEVLRDRGYYRQSGGGVTLSGGEPFCQPEFCRALLAACKEAGLHTAVETNLAWPWEVIRSALPAVDLVMADIKLMDPAGHEAWTGQGNRQVLDNAGRLAGEPLDLIIRTPVIPGVNDTPQAIGAIADFIRGFPNLCYYELLPYHPLGTAKYDGLGMDYGLAGLKAPPRQRVLDLAAVARRRGIAVRPEDRPH